MINFWEPFNYKDELSFIENFENASIFQHPAWLSVISKSYGLDVKVIKDKNIIDGQNPSISIPDFCGGIPFVVKKQGGNVRLISLPFSDHSSLLNSRKINQVILGEIIKQYPDIKIEIRDNYSGNGFESKLVGYKHSLELTNSEEDIFSSFKKTQVQQRIKKALRDELKATIETDYESILQFYRLHLLTRKKLGVPIQPKKFFYYFWNEIVKPGLGYMVMISLKGKIISSGIFAGYNNIMTYKFSASDPEYLNYRPNNLMLWTAIREAKRRGYEILDFGRTDLDTEGLRNFKLGWGTKEEELYYSYYPKAPDASKFEFLKNKIVSPIIQKSPKFVCRLSGEVFYKYFG